MVILVIDALWEDMIEGNFTNFDFGYNMYKMKYFSEMLQKHPDHT